MNFRHSIFKVVSLVMLLMFSETAFPQQQTASKDKDSEATVFRGTQRWRTSTGVSEFNIEIRGKIELTDDDKDIKSISDDGYLEIDKTVFGSRRTIVIESMGGGKMKREYYEGRTQKEWEPNGKTWLSEILPEIVRNTTLGAESRVNRFFKRGGATAVLEEIEKMDSDHSKAYYANLLMKQPVQPKDYPVIVNTVSEELDSDHYITEFLKNNISKLMQSKEATTALFTATNRMESDHYKTVVIKEALRGQIASLENVKIILQSASQMESDHYITEVLTSLLKQENLTDALIAEMITTTLAIESDHYKTVVLTRALDKSGLSNASYQRVIESVKDIESDHYITQVIKHLLDNKLTDQHLTLLLGIMTSIESDHYRSDILRTLLNRQDLQDQQFGKLMETCAGMDSDHYVTVILQQALSSDNLSDAKVITVLNTAKKMDSDHYVTEVLLDAAPRVKTGNVVLKDAYRAAAREISSETYYGRVLRAIE